MEGHRVVRLDVVCYVIVGLGVSGFAWFGSVGRARCGKFRKVMVRSVQAWRGLARQARCGLSSYGVSGSGQERFVLVRQARRVPARLGVVR